MAKESVACLGQFWYSLAGIRMCLTRPLSGRNVVVVRTRYFLSIGVIVNVASFSYVLYS
jgi:hypothetical protein